jgi:hypothetical protein
LRKTQKNVQENSICIRRATGVFSCRVLEIPVPGSQIVGPGEDDRINSRMIKFSGKAMKNDFKEYEFR